MLGLTGRISFIQVKDLLTPNFKQTWSVHVLVFLVTYKNGKYHLSWLWSELLVFCLSQSKRGSTAVFLLLQIFSDVVCLPVVLNLSK